MIVDIKVIEVVTVYMIADIKVIEVLTISEPLE